MDTPLIVLSSLASYFTDPGEILNMPLHNIVKIKSISQSIIRFVSRHSTTPSTLILLCPHKIPGNILYIIYLVQRMQRDNHF